MTLVRKNRIRAGLICGAWGEREERGRERAALAAPWTNVFAHFRFDLCSKVSESASVRVDCNAESGKSGPGGVEPYNLGVNCGANIVNRASSRCRSVGVELRS
jgi:hypothetical protein